MRRLDWIVIILLVIGAIGSKLADFGAQIPETANPRRPNVEFFTPKLWDAETKAWLAKGPTPQKSEFPWSPGLPKEGLIEDKGTKSSSVGSAFSVSTRGVWLTAKHVVEGCSKTVIQIGEKKALLVRRIVLHPKADVAVLMTKNAPLEFPVARSLAGARDAFNIGFPKGQPGAVHSSYLGKLTMRHVRSGQRGGGYREQVNAWAERSRVPARDGSLGGLSGGAVLDDQGRVIGVVQAESARRGRIMTAKPSTIQEVFTYANLSIPTTGSQATDPDLTKDSYPKTARRLITTLRISKVYCSVK